MNQKLNITEMVKRLRSARAEGGFSTLLGIGPMSPMLIRSALELAKEQDFPILFIASRNQIDKAEFGGGYVSHWDQAALCRAISCMADEVGFDGLYYICRDHGGPWQRDEERRAELPEDQAMARGLESYFADVDAGFDLLHIDPTKDPHTAGAVVEMDVVLRRTVSLISQIEAYRRQKGVAPIGYEVGTEETNGGLTGPEAFESFIRRLNALLEAQGLPKPQFIVGQTGTLVRLAENVGRYSYENARRLADISAGAGMELKEHNSDYLFDGVLLSHPALGVGASNVAPEFGVEETRAYIALAALERRLFAQGMLASCGDVERILPEAAVRSGRWRKWMMGEHAQDTAEQVLNNAELTRQICAFSGHYVFEEPAVATALTAMLDNLVSANVPARRFVLDKIKYSIGKYVTAYNLRGLTGRLLGSL